MGKNFSGLENAAIWVRAHTHINIFPVSAVLAHIAEL